MRLDLPKMRTPKLKIKFSDETGPGEGLEEKVFFRTYTTRSVTKHLRENKVIIYETYRCMPLLGNENNVAPDWQEHIVRYTVAFVKKDKV